MYNFTKLQKEWIEALKSGEYKQGELALCKKTQDQNLYCCLGVACEVAIKNGIEIIVEDYPTGKTYNGETASLPARLVNAYKLKSDFGEFDNPECDSLISLNDGCRFGRKKITFEEIAKFIEENPELIFKE